MGHEPPLKSVPIGGPETKDPTMSPNGHDDARKLFLSRAAETEARGLARLAEVLQHADPAELFVAVACSMVVGPPEEFSDARFGTVPAKIERLAWELYPHFQVPEASSLSDSKPSSLEIADLLNCTRALDEIMMGRSMGMERTCTSQEDDIAAQVAGYAEIVRGTAYPHQTERRIREVQGRFDEWYENSVGIAPSRALESLHALIEQTDDAFNTKVVPILQAAAKTFEARWRSAVADSPRRHKGDAPAWIRNVRSAARACELGRAFAFGDAVYRHLPCARPVLCPPLEDTEWESLLALIGMTQERRAGMREPVDVQFCPLYVLPDGRVLIVHLTSTLDALWTAFDEAARQRKPFYDGRYQKHAAKWLEQRTAKLLGEIIPGGEVYRSLSYPDPNTPGGTAELDVAVMWGPFLLLVEAKAKQFRVAGQLGDLGRLRTDLVRNIEESFDQAHRALTYIRAADKTVLKERETGRELKIDRRRIRRVYLITVSMHAFGTLATRLSALRALGLFSTDQYPFAIAEADLDAIAELCAGPEVFLHYIQKRIELHRISADVMADEIDLFAAYLDTRFVNGQLWDGVTDMDAFGLSGYSGQIDKFFQNRWRGIQGESPPTLAIPDEVAAVLTHLRASPGDHGKWIAFCLLDLPSRVLRALGQALAEARQEPPRPGALRRMAFADGDAVVCVLVSRGIPSRDLAKALEERVVIERYRRRLRRGVGIGITIEESAPFTSTVWRDDAWKPDPDLDILVEREPVGVPVPGTRMPGRNEPCICGSGKKFKKCCLEKIENARRNAESVMGTHRSHR